MMLTEREMLSGVPVAMDAASVCHDFTQHFGRPAAGIVRAPGRVNLIGEHTDYNDGYVLPVAIERHTLAAFAPRDDRAVRLRSAHGDATIEFSLDEPIVPGPAAWANYCLGVAAGLVEHGVALVGYDVYFDSSVPIGGGLSSSASLEVAAAMAMLEACGSQVDGPTLARICQKAEHDFANAPVGIMDQSIAILGRAGQALLLDCREGSVRHVPFDDPSVVLLVVDTQVKHDLSDGGYAARRDQCYAAAERLGVRALRDLRPSDFARAVDQQLLHDKELMRTRHVVGEIDRTLQGVEALEQRDYRRFGDLMYASHASLRNDYEVSCEELDSVVDAARACEGVFGARMTGGGFGGCAIVLAEVKAADRVGENIRRSYSDRYGRVCPVFATGAAAGAERIA